MSDCDGLWYTSLGRSPAKWHTILEAMVLRILWSQIFIHHSQSSILTLLNHFQPSFNMILSWHHSSNHMINTKHQPLSRSLRMILSLHLILQEAGPLEGLLAALSSVAADAAQQLSADATEKDRSCKWPTEAKSSNFWGNFEVKNHELWCIPPGFRLCNHVRSLREKCEHTSFRFVVFWGLSLSSFELPLRGLDHYASSWVAGTGHGATHWYPATFQCSLSRSSSFIPFHLLILLQEISDLAVTRLHLVLGLGSR